MHRTVFAQRQAIAMNRIMERAELLSKKVEVPSDFMTQLKSAHIHDPETANLFRLEALALLLDAIAKDYNIAPAPVAVSSTTYAQAFIAPKEKPVAEAPIAEEPIADTELEALSTRSSKRSSSRK